MLECCRPAYKTMLSCRPNVPILSPFTFFSHPQIQLGSLGEICKTEKSSRNREAPVAASYIKVDDNSKPPENSEPKSIIRKYNLEVIINDNE